MNKKNNIADLLKNISFINWLTRQGPTHSEYWENWEKQSKENAELIQDAKDLLKGIPFQKKRVPMTQTEKSWQQLAARLEAPAPSQSANNRRWWLKIAASFIFLIIAGLGINTLINQATLVHHQTSFGEVQSIILPDGSEVQLGANSRLSYLDDLKDRDIRKIELEGEAFFKVAKQVSSKVFTVQTEDIVIEVVGTAFNVNSHRDQSIVSLIEGKLALQKNTLRHILKAGETAIFNEQTEQFDIRTDQTEYWSAWTARKWSFGDGIPMEEVLSRIEENFGLSCQIKDPTILDKTPSGEVSVESREILFEALSFLLDIEFTIQGKQVFIESGASSEN